MPLPSAGPQPVFGTRLLRRLGLPAVAVKPRTSRRLRSCPKSPTLPARQLPRAKPAGTRGSTSPLPSPLLTYRCAVSGGGGGEAEPRPRGGAARPAAAGARGSCAAPPRPAAPGGGGEQRCGAPARRGAPESAVPAGRPSSAACERRSSRGSCAPQPQSGDLGYRAAGEGRRGSALSSRSVLGQNPLWPPKPLLPQPRWWPRIILSTFPSRGRIVPWKCRRWPAQLKRRRYRACWWYGCTFVFLYSVICVDLGKSCVLWKQASAYRHLVCLGIFYCRL